MVPNAKKVPKHSATEGNPGSRIPGCDCALPFESIEAEREYHMFMAGLCTSLLDVKKPNDQQDEIYFGVLDAAVQKRREDAKSPEGI